MSKLETNDLRIHFTEHGSAHGDPVLLLHGWPDDSSTWDDVIARLRGNR
jgi:pimeloyl-ACP methyl ester carboxylesterase